MKLLSLGPYMRIEKWMHTYIEGYIIKGAQASYELDGVSWPKMYGSKIYQKKTPMLDKMRQHTYNDDRQKNQRQQAITKWTLEADGGGMKERWTRSEASDQGDSWFIYNAFSWKRRIHTFEVRLPFDRYDLRVAVMRLRSLHLIICCGSTRWSMSSRE